MKGFSGHTLIHRRIGEPDPECKACSYDALAEKIAAIEALAEDYHERSGRLFRSASTAGEEGRETRDLLSTAMTYDGIAKRLRKALGA